MRAQPQNGRKNKHDSNYLFACITEFSIAAPDARSALKDLQNRTERLHRHHLNTGGSGREYSHRLIATIGGTDIIEIAYDNDYGVVLKADGSVDRQATRRQSRKR